MKTDEFHRLHAAGCFVIPNPWDAGSARYLEQLGFKALATTSSGHAWSLGKSDNHTPLTDALAYFRTIAETVSIPVSADFEGGFAVEPENVATNVRLAIATGIAGLSIEDATGDASKPLYDFELALERVRATRAAIDASNTKVLFTARTEGFVAGRPDLNETIRRLAAFAEAGADCLFAPGLRSLDDIRAVVSAVTPKPVNVLVGAPFTTVQELADIGVRRISVGGALARTAWGGFMNAAREIAQNGTFNTFSNAVAGDVVNNAFRHA